MRKVVLSIMISVDGYIEGPGRDISWHVWNDEMNAYMGNFLESIDTILLGRITYEQMADYWPNAGSNNEDVTITNKMNNLPKLVLSKTITKSSWNNTRFIADNAETEIESMKHQESGRNLVAFGGAELASFLTEKNLIDEYRIIVNPVILGKGTPLFRSVEEIRRLKLIDSKTFACGNNMLRYEPQYTGKKEPLDTNHQDFQRKKNL